jgi:hypothetical protein
MPDQPVASADEHQAFVRCEATRWVSDEPQPGWIEVQLTDADGRTWRFLDKPRVFAGGANISNTTEFPVAVAIPARIIAENDLITVSTDPHGIQAKEGTSTFRVLPSQLVR